MRSHVRSQSHCLAMPILFCTLGGGVRAFDIQGFRTGMSLADVERAAVSSGYSVLDTKLTDQRGRKLYTLGRPGNRMVPA